MTRKTQTVLFAIVVILGVAMAPQAAQLMYDGTLNDAEGRPLPDGAHFFDFRIYPSETDGMSLWAEAHEGVNITNGSYSIVLGERTILDLPPDIYWLEVTVDGEVITPRTKLLLADDDCTITGDLMIDGFVGIGRTSPNYPLHIDQGNVVSGIRTVYGSSWPNNYGEFKMAMADGLIINSNTGGSWAEIRFQNNGTTNMFLRSNGNLGIGTDAPNVKLEAWGSARFGDRSTTPTISGGLVDIHNPSGTGESLLVTSGSFGTEKVFVVEGGGDVGIGKDNPAHLLDVGNSGAYCDGGAWVNGSSREFKENINEITEEQALEVLTDLEPTSFTYKTDDEEVYLGFIAEDVPDLVATKDRKGLVAMDIVAVLTKVVQTQQEQIDDLQEALDRLQ